MRSLSLLSLLMLTFSAMAHAAPLMVTGDVAVLSDYRYQGLSLSNGDPSAHAQLEVSGLGGFYTGISTWSVSGAREGGAYAKTNLYAGLSKRRGLLTYDAGLRYTFFPGAISGYAYAQPYASVRGSIANTSLKLGVSYTPKQGLASRASTYYQSELTQQIMHTPITLKVHTGYVFSRFGPKGDHFDYDAGGDYVWHKLDFHLSYGGTDESRATAGSNFSNVRGKLLGSISYSF